MLDQKITNKLKIITDIIKISEKNITVCIEENTQPLADELINLDELVKKRGFTPIGLSWEKISYSLANDYLYHCLCYGMGHEIERLPYKQAKIVRELFFSFFSSDTMYFTNWEIADSFKKASAQTNISESTFDFVLGAVSAELIGFICIEEEV